MGSDEAPDTSLVEVEDSGPEPTVRCESCGSVIAASASETVHRTYLNRVFPETWCVLCVKSRDQATKRTLASGDDEPDY